jgi:hypothetical protein
MATFYVLPPRALLGRQVARCFASLLPAAELPEPCYDDIAEQLADSLSALPDVYLVHREELPPDSDLRLALEEHFGLEEGDEIVEFGVN